MLDGLAIFEKVVKLPEARIDQKNGKYDGNPCCIGAHLANFLEVADTHQLDFIRGFDAFAKALGGNRAHVILMLREAGAGWLPTSTDPWRLPVKEVYNNLVEIEELPSLVGADLRDADLQYANLQGTNLRGADLEHAILQGADLQGADLENAYLEAATLRCTNLQRANLRNVYLGIANLQGADLRYANLQGARFRDGTFTVANLKDADLRGADLRGTDL